MVIVTTTISKSFQIIIHYKSIYFYFILFYFLIDLFVSYSLSALIQFFVYLYFVVCLTPFVCLFLKKNLL